jgi:amino acid adenylation domain-containing protein
MSPGSYAVPVPLSFDASAAGIYWSLCTGGRVVLPSEDEVRDPGALARLIRLEQVTHVTHMPAYYALLLDAGGHALRTLRDVSVGGDVMPPALVRRHTELLPWAALFNEYGPTEATVWATCRLCTASAGGGPVPIGRPVAGARVYVLDGWLEPVPIGVAGELWIGGSGVARGYHGRAALTAERFLPDPYAPGPGARMYRSGDRARWLASGELEFLGRADAQVKVRGYRVELEEIEAVLGSHPDVAAAAVAVNGETQLTAYVVARAGAPARSHAELVRHLEQRLPGYMIPARTVLLDELPQTPNRKLDRAALAPGKNLAERLAPG